ncbi:MAG: hypothetical protein COW16_12180 [Sphingomonadales bacterium CG12_big_fil_rev_8_21_14_0_65_65_10]|nr:MAG: hypothetical protein COW16_12180 [Sphingomonadales bacterium CG12_big_fil_rev_8_21_14_0_65_65_10]
MERACAALAPLPTAVAFSCAALEFTPTAVAPSPAAVELLPTAVASAPEAVASTPHSSPSSAVLAVASGPSLRLHSGVSSARVEVVSATSEVAASSRLAVRRQVFMV